MAPPSFHIPAPTKPDKKEQSRKSAFTAFVKKHPGLRKWASAIWQAAIDQNVDPVWFAYLINFESGGKNGPVSDRGAIGLGQVTPGKKPEWMDHPATAADLQNPMLNLEVAAWYYRKGYDKTQNWQDAYTKFYNPGYGPGAHGYAGPYGAGMPKGYLAIGTTGTTPTAAANKAAATAVARSNQPVLNDMELRQHYDPIYQAYVGRGMSPKELARLRNNPVSDFQLERQLMQQPAFLRSPIWQMRSQDYFSTWQNIFGPDAQMNPTARNAIKLAILRNYSGAAFQSYLRNQPYYTQSEEYKGLFSQYSGQYQQIYGAPDENAVSQIQMAVKKGWNGDQWTQYLRSQPEWKSSGEYKKMAAGLVNALGFLPQGGGQTVLQQGQAAPTPMGT
jgi:hypothetical protein